MNKKAKIFLQLLGPLIFIYILFQIDYGILAREIKTLKWRFLIFAVLIMALEIIVRCLRWQVILASLGIIISRAKAISLHWLGFFVGIITPGRLGEIIKIYFLKNRGYSVFRSFFSIIVDRIIDILFLLFMGVLTFFFVLPEIGIYIVILGLFLLFGMVFIFLLVNPKSFVHKIFGQLIQKILPVDFNNYNKFTFNKFWQGIKSLKKKEMIWFFFYFLLGWFFYFYARYVLAWSLGLNLSFVDVIVVSILTAIISILPISIAGLGTREAAMIYLFSLFGIGKEAAVLYSLLIFTVNIFVVAFGFIPYLKESALVSKVKKD